MTEQSGRFEVEKMDGAIPLTNLLLALLQAKQEFPPVKKDRSNTFLKAKYATLDSLLEAVEPVLFKNGLLISQAPSVREDGLPTLETKLFHAPTGQSLLSIYLLPKVDDPQKMGSAITYARRYALMAMLSLTADDDDDGEVWKNRNGGNSSKPAKPVDQDAPITEQQAVTLQNAAKRSGWSGVQAKAFLETKGYEATKFVANRDYDDILKAFKAAPGVGSNGNGAVAAAV